MLTRFATLTRTLKCTTRSFSSPATSSNFSPTTRHHHDYNPRRHVYTWLFRNVKASKPPTPPDSNELENAAEAIPSWGLDYVVITSVDRDDMADQGSGHFAETVKLKPNMLYFLIFEGIRNFLLCEESCDVRARRPRSLQVMY